MPTTMCPFGHLKKGQLLSNMFCIFLCGQHNCLCASLDDLEVLAVYVQSISRDICPCVYVCVPQHQEVTKFHNLYIRPQIIFVFHHNLNWFPRQLLLKLVLVLLVSNTFARLTK